MVLVRDSVEYDFDTGLLRMVVAGRLDLIRARELGCAVLRALADQPLGVVLDLDRVTMPAGDLAHVIPALVRLGGDTPILICASPESECGQVLRGLYPGMLVCDTEADAQRQMARGSPGRRRLHSHLAGNRAAAVNARRLIQQACREWNCEQLRPAAEVIVSELVSNSVRHAKSDLEVTVAFGNRRLHLHVRDRSRRLPMLPRRVRAELVDQPRGLALVDALAGGWGTTETPYGKTVWATLPLPSS